MEDEMIVLLAKAFNKVKEVPASKKDLRLTMSFKLGLLAPEEANLLLELALAKDLIYEDDEGLYNPAFDTDISGVSLDFRPSEEFKLSLKSGYIAPTVVESDADPFREDLARALTASGADPGVVFGAVEGLQERLHLDTHSAMLLAAADAGLDTRPFTSRYMEAAAGRLSDTKG